MAVVKSVPPRPSPSPSSSSAPLATCLCTLFAFISACLASAIHLKPAAIFARKPQASTAAAAEEQQRQRQRQPQQIAKTFPCDLLTFLCVRARSLLFKLLSSLRLSVCLSVSLPNFVPLSHPLLLLCCFAKSLQQAVSAPLSCCFAHLMPIYCPFNPAPLLSKICQAHAHTHTYSHCCTMGPSTSLTVI